MAYRRALTSSKQRLAAKPCNPSFAYVLHDSDERKQQPSNECRAWSRNNGFLQRSFGSGGFSGYGAFSRAVPSIGSSFCRNMSTAVGRGGAAEDMGIMSDVAGVLKDSAVEAVASQAGAVNEVAIAAADSYFNVAFLQYCVDGVHTVTGFNWWASIAVTTLLIRGATLPLLIKQLKATSKLAILRPKLQEIKEEMENKGGDLKAMTEGRAKMNKLFTEYGVTPFTPLKGALIQGPVFISFFFAITNMVEKVPSLKVGGHFWFPDLTIPDNLYILPVLTAVLFFITIECNAQEGMEGNPQASLMKNVMRGFAVISVPLTAGFASAIFCYWIPSNFFSLSYGLVIKRPAVRRFLGVPEIPVTPPSANTSPKSFQDVFSAIKRITTSSQDAMSTPMQQSKPEDKRISSSSSGLNHRLKNLEKQVKGRKKNKKR